MSVKVVKKLLEELGEPDVLKGQHFTVKKKLIQLLINSAEISVNDKVVEVGGGLGFLTEELVKTGCDLTVVEIDKRFEQILLKTGAKVLFTNALKVDYSQFNKIVSNMPYNLCEPLFNKLNKDKWKGLIVWTVPKSFAHKIKAEIVHEIPKQWFYPKPKTSSVIIRKQFLN